MVKVGKKIAAAYDTVTDVLEKYGKVSRTRPSAKVPESFVGGPVVVTPPRSVLGPQNECPRLFRRSHFRVLRRFLSDARNIRLLALHCSPRFTTA